MIFFVLFVFFILVVVFFVFFFGSSKFSSIISLSMKGLVIFVDILVELNYENVVGVIGNFSIFNFIGVGGFGLIYSVELVLGFFVVVKSFLIGSF